jgi:hypothetical protein
MCAWATKKKKKMSLFALYVEIMNEMRDPSIVFKTAYVILALEKFVLVSATNYGYLW